MASNNNIPVKLVSVQKCLGIYLNQKQNLNQGLTENIVKANKSLGILKNF